MLSPRYAQVNEDHCVSCGACTHVCPREAIKVVQGISAQVKLELCIGCGRCVRNCPAGTIELRARDKVPSAKPAKVILKPGKLGPAKHWYDYLWLWAFVYFTLGFFNIFFAWLGLLDMCLPLGLALIGGNKFFCNHLCARGQLFQKMGGEWSCSRKVLAPGWLRSHAFRYGFFFFFMVMFSNVLFQTYRVAVGAQSVQEFLKLLLVFKLPLSNGNMGLPLWMLQFSYGLYSLMWTSLVIGFIVMVLFRPRTWCSFCPMGLMTQVICKGKNKK